MSSGPSQEHPAGASFALILPSAPSEGGPATPAGFAPPAGVYTVALTVGGPVETDTEVKEDYIEVSACPHRSR